ncbi:mitotic spindle assembly checkpoint protein MAD1 isoform X2 [Toxorhynchites rutilus septentrionalis]|uniref:mitotic spindle assembly checkpoint protein MAD1 isoform X2 n=1 Tax=Toxorhynchites rutilus septentrionalis TaxID=329112 RepID=UPI00247A6467|nr:mitotic spindle assembly checkpoint protein MAD1 isoform X2 [Toxorhynchites rutilus septentrionalis]
MEISRNESGGQMDTVDDSMTSSIISKRLSFDLLNASFELNRKKRKLYDVNDISRDGNRGPIEDDNISHESINTTQGSILTPMSPWESRRMKADLIEARSRITMLKKEIEHQNTEKATLNLKNQHKISTLEKELNHNVKKVTDLEKHLSVVRKREQAAKEELVKTRNELNILKQSSDDQTYELKRSLKELEQKYNYETGQLQSEASDLNSQIIEIEDQLSMAQEELENYKELNETLQDKANSYDATKKELEEVKDRLSEAESKIKALEYEIGSHEDWKNLSKLSTSRLANYAELEKETSRLKEESKNLHSIIGNKMLLEEEVASLKTRLENFEKNEIDGIALSVQIKELEKELADWRKLAIDFCPKNSVCSPVVVRSLISQILQKDLFLTSEKSSVKNEKDQIQSIIDETKAMNEQLQKQLDDHKRSLKHHQSILHRVQKKLNLVVGERDCWKQLLDSYEKDLTINQSTGNMNNQETQMRMRMDMLEKQLNGYRELNTKMESELQAAKAMPDICMDSALTSEQYEKLRREIDSLQLENEKLKKRKYDLELELENYTLRAVNNRDRVKVVQLTDSPANEAYEAHKNEIEKLQAEIERLRLRNRKLEEGNEELTMRLNESNMTMNVMEANTLKAQIQSLEAKNQHIKDVYKSASNEFREVCYMLFGYRVDRVGNTNYRISSMYAESEEEYLNFRLNETGSVLNMLETEYSASISDMVTQHLGTHGSLPAFLSNLTLDLFNRTTLMVQQYSDSVAT